MSDPDQVMKARIVHMILSKKTEEALHVLSNFYRRNTPKIAVGTVKGKRKTAYAVYVAKEEKIYAMNSDILHNPFVILHEFYHHLRSQSGVHKGTEKHANLYAKDFIDSYRKVVAESRNARHNSNNNP